MTLGTKGHSVGASLPGTGLSFHQRMRPVGRKEKDTKNSVDQLQHKSTRRSTAIRAVTALLFLGFFAWLLL